MPIQVSASINDTTRLSLAGSVSLFCALRKIVPIRPFCQCLQRVTVLQLQIVAGQRPQLRPAPLGRNDRRFAEMLAALLIHLEEQQEGDLLDVVAIADALVTQDMRVVPDLGDQRGIVSSHGASFRRDVDCKSLFSFLKDWFFGRRQRRRGTRLSFLWQAVS